MQSHKQLQSLRDMGDYEVSREDTDVRGWTVVGADGQRVGTVRDLIVDTSRMKVEYLDVGPTGNDATEIRVPVSSARIDTQKREVVVAGALSDDVAGYTEASRAAEAQASSSERRDATTLRRAEEELRIGKREVQAGEVVVGKHVETERVSEPVTVERERVRVERRPVTDVSARADIGPDEIRVPVVEEELIVEKRPVVKEELVVSKERVQETETVDTELRREEFDVRGTPEDLVSGDRNDTASRRRRR